METAVEKKMLAAPEIVSDIKYSTDILEFSVYGEVCDDIFDTERVGINPSPQVDIFSDVSRCNIF